MHGVSGSLYITTFRLRFEPTKQSLRTPGKVHPLLDDAMRGQPRACVSKLTYPQHHKTATRHSDINVPTKIVVHFKDLRSWTLDGDIHSIMATLHRSVFVESPVSLFAFQGLPSRSKAEIENDDRGHRIYDIRADFKRMGVDFNDDFSPLRLTDVNRSYNVCATYPQEFVVPAGVSDRDVATVAEYRSKGRLPVCSYIHPSTSASIWRCAQPKRGLFNSQSSHDEQYLAMLDTSTENRQSRGTHIWIADCRPELNAKMNKFTGGGTESSSLRHVTLTFLNIANIHAMRESMENVRGLASIHRSNADLSWLSRVEDTKWLGHVRGVLSAALQVADRIANQSLSVLVHCSDGWDRTGQLCALAQILLDSHYRTIEGFMQVVEKEWVRIGHKFHDRVGPGVTENDEQAPIFLQFLDCVWQLWRQHPTYFQFNAKLLEYIADAHYSGQFGTFLGNSDRERHSWNLYGRTRSVWADIEQNERAFTNPFYREKSPNLLLPPMSSVLRNVTLWSDYYFRGSMLPSLSPPNRSPPLWADSVAASLAVSKTSQDDLAGAMVAAMQRITELEEEVKRLKGESDSADEEEADVPKKAQSVPLDGPRMGRRPSMSANNIGDDTSFELFPSTSSESTVPPPARRSASVSNVDEGNWTCSICTKSNTAQVESCVVCGCARLTEA